MLTVERGAVGQVLPAKCTQATVTPGRVRWYIKQLRGCAGLSRMQGSGVEVPIKAGLAC